MNRMTNQISTLRRFQFYIEFDIVFKVQLENYNCGCKIKIDNLRLLLLVPIMITPRCLVCGLARFD